MENRLIIPLVRISEKPIGEDSFLAENIKRISSLLLQQSVTKITIIPFDQEEKNQVKTEIEKLSDSTKIHLEIGDSDFTIKRKIEDYFKPILEINNPFQVEVDETVRYGYLETALRVLAVACKKKASAELPMNKNLKIRMEIAKRICNNDDGKTRIDEMIGLFNNYESSPVTGFTTNVGKYDQMKIDSKIDDLLIEPAFQELAELKNNFNIPKMLNNLQNMKEILFHKSKKFLQNPKYREFLNLSQKSALLAGKTLDGGTFTSEISDISSSAIKMLDGWGEFTPQIYDLMNDRIKIVRNMKGLKKKNFWMGQENITKPSSLKNIFEGTIAYNKPTKITIDPKKLMRL